MDEPTMELTLELIPEGAGNKNKKISEAIGAENFYKLCCAVGGDTVYIPKAESITRPALHDKIKKEFTGRNHTELAAKYGFTVKRIRELCGKRRPIEQLSVFDEAGAPP